MTPVRVAPLAPATGTCRVGAASVVLHEPADHQGHMCGYAIASKPIRRPRPGDLTAPLRAQVLVVEGPDGARVAFVATDLWGPSAWMLVQVGNALAATDHLDAGRIVLSATHTHSGPGGYFGNELWNRAPSTLGGPAHTDLRAQLTQRLLAGIRAACADLAAGTVAVGVVPRVLGGANRSLPAFRANRNADLRAFRAVMGPAPTPEESAVDGRLTALCAFRGSTLRAVFATWACHATTLGQKQDCIHPDWPGRVHAAAGFGPHTVLGLAQGAAGDVSPLPVSELRAGGQNAAQHQGLQLADTVAASVGNALRTVLAGVTPTPTSVRTRWTTWVPPVRHQLGPQAAGGAEDYRSCVAGWRQCGEGNREESLPDSAQWPKRRPRGGIAMALGTLHRAEGPAALPLHQVEVAGHRWVTLPGEPTGVAAHCLERDFAGPTTVVGYAGEYAGYLTTHGEYATQHYEGAMTVYGRDSLRQLRDRHEDLAAGTAPAPTSWTFSVP